MSLEIRHPDVEAVEALLRSIGLEDPVAIVRSDAPGLVAVIRTPGGPRRLESAAPTPRS